MPLISFLHERGWRQTFSVWGGERRKDEEEEGGEEGDEEGEGGN